MITGLGLEDNLGLSSLKGRCASLHRWWHHAGSRPVQHVLCLSSIGEMGTISDPRPAGHVSFQTGLPVHRVSLKLCTIRARQETISPGNVLGRCY